MGDWGGSLDVLGNECSDRGKQKDNNLNAYVNNEEWTCGSLVTEPVIMWYYALPQ